MRGAFGAIVLSAIWVSGAAGQWRPASFKLLPSNLLSDQKRIWLAPRQLTHPRHWIAPAVVVGATALLVAEADAPTASYFRRSSSFDGFKQVFTGRATTYGMVAVPSSLLIVGLARRDSKMWQTALLAGEAVADTEVLTVLMKDAGRRLYPASVPAQQGFSGTWFKTKGEWLRGSGSFPGGHAAAAFSIATVFARRYGNHRWVRYAAFGGAALVAFSRLPLGAHYVSDTLVGTALGYSVGRFAVLRQ